MKHLFLLLLTLFISVASFGSITPITGTDSICVGSSVMLTDATIGGTWSSSTTSIATVGTDGTVTGIAIGTSTITYTIGASYVTALAKVKDTPVITITVLPGDTICAGIPVLLYATVVGGSSASSTSFEWLLFVSHLSYSDSLTIEPVYGDPFVCVFTGISQCNGTTITLASDTIHMIVNPPPTITISKRDSICEGEFDTLIAHSSGGIASISWLPSTALVCPFCDTTLTTISSLQTYTVTITDLHGCTNTSSFTVSVNPLPLIHVSPNTATICLDSSIQLHATGADTYLWYPNTGLSCDTCANPFVSVTSNIYYHTIGKTIFGCADSNFVSITVDTCTSGLPILIENVGLELYPNPTTTAITIQSTNQPIRQITITNLLGQTIYTHEYSSEKVQIDVSTFPTGIYFIKVNGETNKFVKE